MLRQLFSILRGIFKEDSKKDILLPTSDRRIGFVGLTMFLSKLCPNDSLFLGDRDFLLCSKSDIQEFLSQDKTNRREYVTEKFDCEDFAFRLMGQFSIYPWSDLAFGIVWTELHALNCFVDENEVFWFVEPQTDEILTALKPWMGTEIRFITM